MTKFSDHLPYLLQIIWHASKRFYISNYTYKASALAFVTILSLVPIISLMVYFVGHFPLFSHLTNAANSYINANFLPSSGNAVSVYLAKFTLQAAKLPTGSILFFLVTNIMLIVMIENSLNEVWQVHHIDKDLTKQFIIWITLICMPLIIGLSASLSELVYSFLSLSKLQNYLIVVLNLLLNSFIFAFIYFLVPNKYIHWKLAMIGGITTAILFECLKRLFVYYINYFTSYEFIYGTLASIPIFLIWIYLFWCIFLYGALVMEAKDTIDYIDKNYQKK